MATTTPTIVRKSKNLVLLIEDDVFIIELLGHQFKNKEFDFVFANNGKDGIAKFQECNPDLIMLDLLLPDIKGLDALRQIRRLPGGADVKVIVFSNIAEESDIQESKRLGAIDYLIKANYSLPEVVKRIQTALGDK